MCIPKILRLRSKPPTVRAIVVPRERAPFIRHALLTRRSRICGLPRPRFGGPLLRKLEAGDTPSAQHKDFALSDVYQAVPERLSRDGNEVAFVVTDKYGDPFVWPGASGPVVARHIEVTDEQTAAQGREFGVFCIDENGCGSRIEKVQDAEGFWVEKEVPNLVSVPVARELPPEWFERPPYALWGALIAGASMWAGLGYWLMHNGMPWP